VLFSLSKWKIWRKFITTYKWILWGDINICYSNKSPTRCNNFAVYYPDIQWLNRKEWCLGSGRRRQLSQDQKDRLIILTFIYSSTCFGRFPAHHKELGGFSGSLWFYLRIVVTVVLCWHNWHHDTKVKPEGATAVIELLMMGRKTPKTCWAVNKR